MRIQDELISSKFVDVISSTSFIKEKRPNGHKTKFGLKTGVDLSHPEKPPKRAVTQPKGTFCSDRCDRFIYNKIIIDHEGDFLRKLKSRLSTLTVSIRSLKGHYSPFKRFNRILKRIQYADSWMLQKISNLLVGGLVFTNYPVGISLSKNIQMIVKAPSPTITRRIVSCLPFWGTSYTWSNVSCIVSLLNKVSTRPRSIATNTSIINRADASPLWVKLGVVIRPPSGLGSAARARANSCL